MNALNFLRVLLHRMWLILAVVGLAMITAFIISVNAPGKYKATAQLRAGIIGSHAPLFEEIEFKRKRLFETEARFNTRIAVLRSESILQLLSFRLLQHDITAQTPFRNTDDLYATYTRQDIQNALPSLKTRLDSMDFFRGGNDPELTYLNSMVAALGYEPSSLRSALDLRRIPGTDLIEVSITTENPQLSSFAVNTMGKEFIRFYDRKERDEARRRLRNFRELVVKNRKAFENKLKTELAKQGRSAPSASIEQSMRLLSNLVRVEEIRENARIRFRAAERTMEIIDRQLTADELSDIQEILKGKDARLAHHRRLLKELNRKYLRNNPPSSRTADSLELLVKLFADRSLDLTLEKQELLSPMRSDMMAQKLDLEAQLAMTQETIYNADIELRRMTGFKPEVWMMVFENSEVLEAREAYLTSLENLTTANLALSGNSLGIGLVSPINPPVTKEPSQVAARVILAGLISMVLVGMVLFVFSYLDRSIKYPSRLTMLTRLPMMGSLNRIASRNLDLVALFQQTSTDKQQEVFKQLLRKIRFEINERNPKVMLVTSMRDAEGKTSLMISLAFSMSLNKKRVLLIDANFKNPSLTEITGAKPALEAYLNGETTRRQLISTTVFAEVDVIGCEGGNYSPSEVFKSEDFAELLQTLRGEYDHIFIEGSILNRTSDSREFAGFVDLVVVVVSASTTIRQAERDSLSFLKKLDGPEVAAILNKVDKANMRL